MPKTETGTSPRAVRIAEGVELPEYALPADRVLPVVDVAYPDQETYLRHAIAFMWTKAQEEGALEGQFRAALQADEELAHLADEPFEAFEPAATITVDEANKLVEQGYAEAVS